MTGDKTALAIKLARLERDKLEDEIIELDSVVSQTSQRITDLKAETDALSKEYDFQWLARRTKEQAHHRLGELIRDLKRDREGWPFLTDMEYSVRMIEVRKEIEELLGLTGS